MLNYHVLIFMGLILEIFGALFLSMEAIGIQRFTRTYKYIYKISSWSKKNLFRLSLLSAPPFLLILIGFLFRIELLVGLSIPLLFLSSLTSILIDFPHLNEKWIIIKTKEGKIGPIGFLIIVLGNILQLISVVWQMSLGV